MIEILHIKNEDSCVPVEKAINIQDLLQKLGLSPIKKYTEQPDSDVIRAICPKCKSRRSLSYNKKDNKFSCAYIKCRIQGTGAVDLIAKCISRVFIKESKLLVSLCDSQ